MNGLCLEKSAFIVATEKALLDATLGNEEMKDVDVCLSWLVDRIPVVLLPRVSTALNVTVNTAGKLPVEKSWFISAKRMSLKVITLPFSDSSSIAVLS